MPDLTIRRPARIWGAPHASDAGRQRTAYRHDLDGLRGLAIVLVAVFHVWFGRVSGGVDVFLALSGFFFGGRLLRTALDPDAPLSVVAEVIRLVRRLVPALVIVLAASAVLTILVQPQTRWETFADQSLASLGYFQNWELAHTAANYLRAGEAVSPLQHIWSMSVQGQFYIALLAVAVACPFLVRCRTANHLSAAMIATLGALAVASFVYATVAHNADQSAAYYDSFARAWELVLGALTAALIPHIRWPMWLRTAIGSVALVAIMSCGALIDGVRQFPGPWALFPVGATLLLILAAANLQADRRMPLPNRVLASRSLVTLGALAYSLYLWHWPLLIFWLAYSDRSRAGLVDGAAMLIVSYMLAYLTTRFVENPLRHRSRTTVVAASGASRIRWYRRPAIVGGWAVMLLAVSVTVSLTLGALAYSLNLWHWPLLIFWLAYSDRSRAGLVDGAAMLIVSYMLAYLTTRFVRSRTTVVAGSGASRIRWYRRPAIVGGWAVMLLAVSVTVSSFSWRQHMAVVRANGTDLSTLSVRDYPGAHALLGNVRVPQLPMRPTILEASSDLPETTTAGCISDFGNAELIKCTYGDVSAARTIALAGGSHAEHWITALDLLGRQHQFKIVTFLKMGCPLSMEQTPIVTGSLDPFPQCRQWVEQVMSRMIADRPDYVFTTTTRPRIEPGDEVPASYLGVWDILSRNGIGILGMRDTPWLVHNGQPSAPADCLAQGGDAVTCGVPRSDVLADRNPTLDITAEFPLLIPLDMSDAVCRRDICRAVEGNVLIYRDSHHLSATYVRTMTPELGRQIGTATGWW